MSTFGYPMRWKVAAKFQCGNNCIRAELTCESANNGWKRKCTLCLVHSFTIESERDISMLHSEGSDVRIVAFRVDSGVSSVDLAQTDGGFRVLYEPTLGWRRLFGHLSTTRFNVTLCCDLVMLSVACR